MIHAQCIHRRGQLCVFALLAVFSVGLATSARGEGACCLSNPGTNECAIQSREDCARSGGVFAGDGTQCGNFVCMPPPQSDPRGACCIPVGGPVGGTNSMFAFCAQLTNAECSTYAGSYQGDDATCPTTFFPPEQAQSCFGDGHILVRPGDMNLDGFVNGFDIDIFVEGLVNPERFPHTYPDSLLLIADVNRDGNVDFFDVDPFLELLGSNPP